MNVKDIEQKMGIITSIKVAMSPNNISNLDYICHKSVELQRNLKH